ncbi:MAG: hypothetical protein HYY61_00370 [Deltaproteobacteria bacterium]|nr:hypothetical protein [Deltaproteobacteria bacterium]
MSWYLQYGIITDDYGIVTDEDIRKEAEISEPQPIIEEFSPFMVWQCLRLVHVWMECIPTGDEIVPCSPGVSAILKIYDGEALYEFITRRPMEIDSCDDMISQWHHLMDGEEVACVSASYDLDLPISDNDPWFRYSSWTINRVKSHQGSWSYFVEQEN